MPIALEIFLSQLSSSGIVPEDKLKVVVSKKANFADGEALARDMIKLRLLTKYQAEQILGGKGKNLSMGKYQILEKIGAGGMGQVYKAFHKSTERIVAIKMILGKGKIDPDIAKRFEREVKAAAKLVHANIITVFDADQADGRIFMVMEYISGNDLGELLRKKGQLKVSEVVQYMLQAARGLKYAHDQGVIHRDIKPGNILVDSNGNVKIVDMGLAKLESKNADESISILTASASIMGTIDFMSPEQGFSSKNVDARTDIYSLGATLFFLLSRKVMYPGDSAFEKMLAHRESPIPSLQKIRTDIPPELQTVFTKMVAKKVEDRYSHMAEVILALSRLQIVNPESSVWTKDLTTTNFERGRFEETIDFESVITNGGKGGNKETNKNVAVKTLVYTRFLNLKPNYAWAIMTTVIIVLVLLTSILLLNPGKNIKEEVKVQVAELSKLKQEEETKAKQVQVEMVKLKQEEETKAKQVEMVKLKQEEEAKAKQVEMVKLKQEEEAKAYKNQGDTNSKLSKYNEAIINYTKAIALDPKYTVAYNSRGLAYYELEKYEEAFADYTTAIGIDPKFSDIYINRGLANSKLSKNTEALADYLKAIQLDPKCAAAYKNRALVYININKHTEAIADCDKAIELDPKYMAAYNNRGIAYSRLNMFQESIADYNKAIELDPKIAKPYSGRGIVNSKLNKSSEAIADFTKAIELDPKFSAAYRFRATSYLGLNKYAEAIADFTKAIELDPKNEYSYTFRGIAYYGLKLYPESIADCTKVIEVNPKNRIAYFNRGLAYKALGKTKEANADFAKDKELEK